MSAPEIFNYRLPATVAGVFPGAHAGQMVGMGKLFKRHAPLIASPDPRRIDLRASVLDPYRQFSVRVYQQASQLSVYLLADLSASMSFSGDQDKKTILRDCLLSIAASAEQAGDRFGFIGCADGIDPAHVLLASKVDSGRVLQLAERLFQLRLTGRAQGLLQACRYLPPKPSLIFLLSDFYLPPAFINRLLSVFAPHTLIPLVIWDRREYDNLPPWGLLHLRDAETGKHRMVLMRPQLRRRITEAFRQRRQQLQRQLQSLGCEPLFLRNGYSAGQLEHYFQRMTALTGDRR